MSFATWQLPTREIGRIVFVFDSLVSTNSTALEMSRDSFPSGTAILADQQTSGRGQYGRVWQAPPRSSVLLSVLLRPLPQLRRPVLLTALAAVAVSQVVEIVTHAPAQIKWPNDVLIHGRKVSGILIESTGSAVVIGIGLNVRQNRQQLDDAGLPEATSLQLQATSSVAESHDIARNLLQNLDALYAPLCEEGVIALERDWIKGLGLLEMPVQVELTEGGTFPARIREISFDAILLQTQTGEILSLAPERIRHLTPCDRF